MDYSYSEQQEMMRKTSRQFLEKECPTSLVRQMEGDEKGYPPQLWQKMAEQGWMGLVFPSEYGGGGGSFLDLVILLEEMGRSLVPGPFVPTVVYGGLPILAAGTEEQKGKFLPGIAKGELTLTLALTEPSARFDAAGVEARAVPDGNDFRVSGTKLFVPYAHVADLLLLVARTGGKPGGESGITIFIVEAKRPGISYTLLDTIASDRQCEVILDGVRVSRSDVLGEIDRGWEVVKRIEEFGAAAQCALMVGQAHKVLDMTVEYTTNRIQYGRPIGSFQVIHHRTADMFIDIEAARMATYQAAWKLSEGLPATTEVSVAKAWTSDACQRVCADGCHLHGAIGFTEEHDVQLYLRRAKAAELAFGDATYHRDIVARQVLDT